MILNLLIKPFVNFKYSRALTVEKSIGYALKLNKLSPNWIDGQMIFDMTPVWQKVGINAQGVNYFTIGSIVNKKSSRFDYESPYYQSWFGGYVVRFSKSRKWSINDHFELGVADQNEWLSLYGDPKPCTEIEYKTIKKHFSINIGSYKAQLYEGSIYTHTDVGRSGGFSLFPLYMYGFAQIFNISNPKMHLQAKHLIPPQWSNKIPIQQFQKVKLHGYIAIVTVTSHIKVVIYINGAIFTDNKGNKYNTYKQLKSEMKKLIEETEIIKLYSRNSDL